MNKCLYIPGVGWFYEARGISFQTKGAAVYYMHETEGLPWAEIANRIPGANIGNCTSAYRYYKQSHR